jgi:hypothetical protein
MRGRASLEHEEADLLTSEGLKGPKRAESGSRRLERADKAQSAVLKCFIP